MDLENQSISEPVSVLKDSETPSVLPLVEVVASPSAQSEPDDLDSKSGILPKGVPAKRKLKKRVSFVNESSQDMRIVSGKRCFEQCAR